MMSMNYNNSQNPMFLNMNNFYNNYYNNMNQMNSDILNYNMNQNNNIPNMNNINMNFNQINQNISDNQLNDAEDILPYIEEPKKIIQFSNISNIKNGTFFAIKVPNSLTKSELYSIAKKYQVDYYSDIILSYNNYLLKNDDSLIEGIPEGSIINIIEDVDIPDCSYYNNLMKLHENEEIINLQFRFLNNNTRIVPFPKNITVSEMIKAAFSKFLLNSKSSRIMGLSLSDNSKINTKFCELQSFNIFEADILENHWRFGKLIKVKAIGLDKANNEVNIYVSIGTLNSTKQLIESIGSHFGKKIKKIYIGKFEIDNNFIKSLKSIGIIDNCLCKVEFEK